MRAQRLLATVFVVALLGVSNVSAAPILWIDDSSGSIGTVDVATGAATFIGNSGVILTDIAFDPLGNLWGVSFTNLYKINKTTGAATLVGSLGATNGANALVFASDGTLYAAATNSTDLYTVNTSTGAATSLGSTGFSSAGDLAFNGGALYMSSTGADLIRISLPSAAGTLVGPLGFTSVFGLATADNSILYGVSGTQVFSVNTTTGAGTLVTDYAGGPLGSANGTAFVTEAGATVPEPSTMLLLSVALVGIAAGRRRRA